MRFKPSTYRCKGITRQHQYYKKETGDKIGFHLYRDVTDEVNKRMMDKVLENQMVWYLPHRTGKIFVTKSNKCELRGKAMVIDFAATKKAGQLVTHENDHTRGFIYKFVWSPRGIMMIKGMRIYMFQITRGNKAKLAKILKDPERTFDYIKYI